jgi:hypothetical protein
MQKSIHQNAYFDFAGFFPFLKISNKRSVNYFDAGPVILIHSSADFQCLKPIREHDDHVILEQGAVLREQRFDNKFADPCPSPVPGAIGGYPAPMKPGQCASN